MIPLIYAAVATTYCSHHAASVEFPLSTPLFHHQRRRRNRHLFFSGFWHDGSESIVFSLTFLMVQFSATAYSPRLVIWISRDLVVSHALGVFIATFV
jgi:hypothetical protein